MPIFHETFLLPFNIVTDWVSLLPPPPHFASGSFSHSCNGLNGAIATATAPATANRWLCRPSPGPQAVGGRRSRECNGDVAIILSYSLIRLKGPRSGVPSEMNSQLEPFDVLGLHYKNERLQSVLCIITSNSPLNSKKPGPTQEIESSTMMQLFDSTPLARPGRTEQRSVIARMFYHTALICLAQTNPMISVSQDEVRDMQNMQMQDAQTLCGIIAHVKDGYHSHHAYLPATHLPRTHYLSWSP